MTWNYTKTICWQLALKRNLLFLTNSLKDSVLRHFGTGNAFLIRYLYLHRPSKTKAMIILMIEINKGFISKRFLFIKQSVFTSSKDLKWTKEFILKNCSRMICLRKNPSKKSPSVPLFEPYSWSGPWITVQKWEIQLNSTWAY